MLHIKSAKYLSNSLIGPVFEPLKDVRIFAKVVVDPKLETVVWPNGADLAPEYLKDLHSQQMLAKEKPKGD